MKSVQSSSIMRIIPKRMVYFMFLLCILFGFYFLSFKFTQNTYIDRSDYKATLLEHSGVRGLMTYDVAVTVFIFSNRNSLNRRETIRNTWGKGQRHVYFLVSGQYCKYPLNQRLPGKCEPKDKSRALDQEYIDREEELTLKLRNENNVILINTTDIYQDISNSISHSNKWMLNKVNSAWILHTDDSVDINLKPLEEYLKSELDPTEDTIMIQLLKCEQAKVNSKTDKEYTSGSKPGSFSPFMCTFNQVVSRQYINTFKDVDKSMFEYNFSNNKTLIRISDSSFIQSIHRENHLNFISKTGKEDKPEVMIINLALVNKQVKDKDDKVIHMENPSLYLNTDRFDIIVKMVYAYFYVFEKRVPPVIKDAYIEHLRVWNHFKEGCGMKKVWFDSKVECTNKKSSSDFIAAFHKTIENIKAHGFSADRSRIPVDKGGFVLNGAHRVSSSVILSANVSFDHQTYAQHIGWGYKHFKGLGLSEKYFKIVMLEWMKIQMKLPDLKTHVSIVSIFSNDKKKDEAMRKIVMEKCSKDNGIVYETNVELTKRGARQLQSHMYGKQSWLETKIQQMTAKFNSTFNALFLFIYARKQSELVQCKSEIRKHYNDKVFKSTVHIPDNMEENLILAEMILNPNSAQFMNYAKDPDDCKLIASEIAKRASKISIKTLPGLFIGRQDIMVDSGTVLGFFGLRKRTDVDLLFENEIDQSILGNKNKMSIQPHAFKNNSISNGRPWGEDHFKTKEVKNPLDLFYNPENYGYCYGIKFVSLNQLIRYKTVRNEPNKDMVDVNLIKTFLNSTKS